MSYPLEHRGEAVVFSLVAEARLPGFPLRFTYDEPIASTREPVRSVDRLVDVDGDGRAEILTSEVQRLTGLEQTHTTVRIHDSTGLEVGRNVFVATLPWSSGLGIPGLRRGEVADLDLDGRYDFALPVPQAELHVQPLALPSTPQADPQGPPLSRPADWPTFRQNLQRTGALD